MGSVRKILEEIKWGISPEVLAKKHPWEELASQDPEELLNFARYQRDSQQSYNTLVYLFRTSRDKDLWFSVEVLSQALQHPAMNSEDRNTILRTMRSRLDRIKDEVTARQPNEEKIRKYWLLEASYYAIHGTTLAETDRTEEAVENYQIAAGIFQQLGLTQQAENFNHKIERLSSRVPRPAAPPQKPAARPPTQASAMSASFRGTMELVAAGQLPPTHSPLPAHAEPEAAAPMAEPVALPPAFIVDPPASVVPTVQTGSDPMPFTPFAAEGAPPSNGRAEPAENPAADAAERTIIPAALANISAAPIQPEAEAELPAVGISKEMNFKPDDEAAHPQLMEKLAEKNQELARLTHEIEDSADILIEVQLEIRMYQERRSLLFREVQNLEKKAAYLKELNNRLERKSHKPETGS